MIDELNIDGRDRRDCFEAPCVEGEKSLFAKASFRRPLCVFSDDSRNGQGHGLRAFRHINSLPLLFALATKANRGAESIRVLVSAAA
jgi:hypothetical protein